MPTVDLTDAEHAAITELISRAVEQDRFPRAPRLDPLRLALAKLDPAQRLRQNVATRLPRPSGATDNYFSFSRCGCIKHRSGLAEPASLGPSPIPPSATVLWSPRRG
jgi:hypothetical protein